MRKVEESGLSFDTVKGREACFFWQWLNLVHIKAVECPPTCKQIRAGKICIRMCAYVTSRHRIAKLCHDKQLEASSIKFVVSMSKPSRTV